MLQGKLLIFWSLLLVDCLMLVLVLVWKWQRGRNLLMRLYEHRWS